MNSDMPDKVDQNKEDQNEAQLKKYAEDLVAVYQSEKQKRKELEVKNRQLEKCAGDLSRVLSELKVLHGDLNDAYLDTIHRLVMAAEYKDDDTGAHIVRITGYSVLVAEKLGLSDTEIRNVQYAAPMHDVGKIGIPDSILMKPGRLTAEEFEVVKTHTTIGAAILSNAKATILQVAETIARSHHEKWNGKGYPLGLAGKDIPLVGRIVAIADTFDALTSKRPYKDPYPVSVALDIIRKERGQQFDPDVVDVFLENREEAERIKHSVSDQETINLSSFRLSDRDQYLAGRLGLPAGCAVGLPED